MPEIPLRVVVNSTPIIALSLIRSLELLHHLYTEVLIPPAVFTEVLNGGIERAGIIELQNASWIRQTSLQIPRNTDLLVDLDQGEAEVIILALEQNANLVILDERLARRHARRLNLPLTGTLGVLLRAKQRGLVPSVRPLIDELHHRGIWLGDRVIAETLRLANEEEASG
jgi:predicted nucleic acid-binding protein